jgi:hypothetical protein
VIKGLHFEGVSGIGPDENDDRPKCLQLISADADLAALDVCIGERLLKFTAQEEAMRSTLDGPNLRIALATSGELFACGSLDNEQMIEMPQIISQQLPDVALPTHR